MYKIHLSVLIAHFTLILVAQDCELKFENITTAQGLSASWVRTIYEDRFGFMWFGTSDGLNRYDAYTTRVYQPDEKKDFSLVSGAINHLQCLNKDKLLVCTEQGVNLFDFESEKFLPFPYLDNVRVTYALPSDDKIWFTSYSGLFCYNATDSSLSTFKHNQHDETSLGHNQSTMCYIDKGKNLWVATFNGLDRYDPENNTFHHYLRDSRKSIPYRINAIIEDDNQRLWVGIAKEGLSVLIRDQENYPEGEFIHILDGSVSRLIIDRQNILWVGNDIGMGIDRIPLNRFDPYDPVTYCRYKGIPGKFMSLSDNTISSLYQDRNGGIWVGTFAGGVNYYSPWMKQFNVVHQVPGDTKSLSNNVVNCFVDDGQYLWVGTEEGLCRLNKSTHEFHTYYYEEGNPHSLGANGVICMVKDHQGNLWIGTWTGGLNLYNPSSGDFTRFLSDQSKEGTLGSNNVFALLEDRRGNLWVGTDGGGLNLYDPDSRSFKKYQPDPENPSSLYHNAVNDICETSDGKLFISVYHALELFDYETETFTHFIHDKEDTTSIGPGIIIDVFEDSKNHLWIATSAGLNYFDRTSGVFNRYTTSDGLPGNTIQSVLEDDQGNLWLGTNKGITKFLHGIQIPEKPVFITYTVDDGLLTDEYIRRSVLKTTGNLFYFGGSKGYIYFYPDSILENQVQSEVVLTDFRLFGESGEYLNERDILDKEINHVERIELKHDQSDFIIRFAVLNYLNPQKNKYTYILDGYDKDWHKVGNERTATYTNINPGKYTFRVKALNNDGIWSTNEKTIIIRIKPAWWGTTGFIIPVILIVFLVIYFLYRLRVRMYKNQQKMLEEMVRERTTELSELNTVLEEKQEEISIQNDELNKHRTNLEKLVNDRTEAMKEALKRAEEADRLKSAFLANMSHEIRTPMNAIVGFATLLTNDDLTDEERREYLDIINNNSQTLMVLINDILEISLIEANQLRLNKSRFNVTDILEEMDSYYRLKNQKDIELEFVNGNDEKALFLYSDQTRFRQIFTNLLNNAFKYTELGKISFGYEIQGEDVKFFVKDTGIGIAESEYENIFNYFHKIDKGDNKLYRGAGIGLSISNKLVELMGGKIWLNSEVGKGTSFYFTLPPGTEVNNMDISETARYDKSNSLEGVTVLVAEDETTNYKLIEGILKPTKAKLIWAENGQEAVDKVKELNSIKNCVILMDIKMPILNGITATKKIKKLYPELPVIAVTAYAQPKDREQLMKEKFIDYLAKPIKAELLLIKIFKYAFINE
jgi:signal transduction histidine kinase/ligand-binding sensor domain-containing protein/CheY-like chemotaxis protein